jgi:hypothetical protein
MWLTGVKSAKLVYTLTDLPPDLITKEAYSYANYNNIEYSPEIEQKIADLYTYTFEPIELRLKIFDIEYNPEFIEKLKQQVEKSRNFIKIINNA